MEYRDLYDKNRTLTGEKILSTKEIPHDKFILVVVIFIQNTKGEFLIQKRSKKKDGLWATTGGHPKSGESSLNGIITEVKEELGIDIKNPILFKQATGKNTFCDLYYLKQDIDLNNIKLQKDEVEEVKWVSIDEINLLMEKSEFKKGHYIMLKDCLEYLQNKS